MIDSEQVADYAIVKIAMLAATDIETESVILEAVIHGLHWSVEEKFMTARPKTLAEFFGMTERIPQPWHESPFDNYFQRLEWRRQLAREMSYLPTDAGIVYLYDNLEDVVYLQKKNQWCQI